MKTWKKYMNYLMEGEWHIHTNYTDGENTIIEYCQKAIELGVPLLAFTEHVRKNLNYDFNNFLDDIEKAKDEFDLIILSGCEAKVLPNGELDVEKHILKEVDYPIFAFHSFLGDINLHIKSLNNVLRNRYINTWAHPRTLGLELSEDELSEIFILMKDQNILLETNKKYNTLPERWIYMARKYNVELVRGDDIHSIGELIKIEKNI